MRERVQNRLDLTNNEKQSELETKTKQKQAILHFYSNKTKKKTMIRNKIRLLKSTRTGFVSSLG